MMGFMCFGKQWRSLSRKEVKEKKHKAHVLWEGGVSLKEEWHPVVQHEWLRREIKKLEKERRDLNRTLRNAKKRYIELGVILNDMNK